MLNDNNLPHVVSSREQAADDERYVVVDGVRKTYLSRQGETPALSEVSLEASRQSFVSLVGPSGCGKSTLLQIIGGLVPASSGQVLLSGHVIHDPHESIVYVFQQYTKSLFPWKTVAANVAFGLENRKSRPSREEIDQRVNEYISELVGLGGFEGHYPWQLSGGMQQRVALARALVCRPDVLLMDEPLGSLDAITRSELQDLILRLWHEHGLTIIFVTHDIDEALYLSDRVVVLTGAPGAVTCDMEIDLPRPRHQIRTRADSAYIEYRSQLFKAVSPSLAASA